MTDQRGPGAEGIENEPPVLELLGFENPVPIDVQIPVVAPEWVPLAEAPLNEIAVPVAALAVPAPAPLAPPTSRRELREREQRTSSSRPKSRSASQRPAAPAPRGPRRPSRARNIGSRLLSFAAMLFAGALAIGMSVPANAFNTSPDIVLAEAAATGPVQTVDVAESDTPLSERDSWTVTSWAEMLRARYGTRDFSYTVGVGAIRWPFPYAVPISSGFGERVAPCRGCSTYHQGLDFNPGLGAPVYAIADGVVTEREDGYGGFGNFVVITHQIDGETVTSTYAHMQHLSSPIVLGQEIKVGDFLGLVGETGQATGPHLHFEIHVDAVKVDPFAWLQAHAT